MASFCHDSFLFFALLFFYQFRVSYTYTYSFLLSLSPTCSSQPYHFMPKNLNCWFSQSHSIPPSCFLSCNSKWSSREVNGRESNLGAIGKCYPIRTRGWSVCYLRSAKEAQELPDEVGPQWQKGPGSYVTPKNTTHTLSTKPTIKCNQMNSIRALFPLYRASRQENSVPTGWSSAANSKRTRREEAEQVVEPDDFTSSPVQAAGN